MRRLTRSKRSANGSSRTTPGPRSSTSRPSRNTTPRSYSRRTRTEAEARTSPSKAITATDDQEGRSGSSVQLQFFGLANVQGQPIDVFDDHAVTVVQDFSFVQRARSGAPQTAIENTREALPSARITPTCPTIACGPERGPHAPYRSQLRPSSTNPPTASDADGTGNREHGCRSGGGSRSTATPRRRLQRPPRGRQSASGREVRLDQQQHQRGDHADKTQRGHRLSRTERGLLVMLGS